MAKKILSKKREEYVRRRKPQKLGGKTLRYNAAVQDRYMKGLIALVKQMTQQTEREIVKLFKSETAEQFFATDANITAQAKMTTNRLTKKFEQLFKMKSQGLAETMVKQTEKASSANLHSSLKELSGGLSLGTRVFTGEMNTVMTAAIAENVGLIKSIAQEYLKNVQGAVMRSITIGNGLQDLVPFFEKQEGITIRRARNIALDQTRKTYNTISAEKMKKIGVTEYEWIHSGGGQHPREDHIAMNGKIFSLTDPDKMAIIDKDGTRGKPSDAINCRCVMRPIISFDTGEEE